MIGDFRNLESIWRELQSPSNAATRHLHKRLHEIQPDNRSWLRPVFNQDEFEIGLVEGLNRIVSNGSFYEPKAFAEIQLSETTAALLRQAPKEEPLEILNACLVKEVFTDAIWSPQQNGLIRLIREYRHSFSEESARRILGIVAAPIMHYLQVSGCPHGDEQDLHQDCVAAFFRRFDGMRATSDLEVKALIRRICHNKVVDRLRKRGGQVNLDFNDEGIQTHIQVALKERELDAVTAERFQIVLEAIRQMEPEKARLILLKYYREFTYKEIAEMLHDSAGAIKMRTSRALMDLKKQIGKQI